ncbi:surface adhesion protein [Oceanospirillum multiglobuliferum]|uniref:LapA adhesin domain-containing protein n=1 Tax=Oceanospirillum multiglobuliferum TaxID=64969 RepID=A0A1T4P318_9GAMM|nr:immunoglobulin-like domain-containing protein [Oceanospirillum multiglobuliferum]OPX55102.1 hypothetical protein BTE48_10755 [Oceanospirillum multiglobuliferum]SJZ85348.1 surface adhesion protein [Oceanospirillum multiglobuliferum]
MQKIKRKNLALALAVLSSSITTYAYAEVQRPFEVRFQDNLNGNIVFTGNSLMAPKSDGKKAPSENINNDRVDMQYIDIDDDAKTNKSSQALLDIQSNSEVVYAALYWGGRLSDVDKYGREAWLKAPNNGYEVVQANWVATPNNTNYYAAFADVTELVRKGGRGFYTLANIGAQTGEDRFGGWSLVVIERNDLFPFRNITLFDGYASIPEQVDIKVEGFVAPRFGAFNASMGVVAYEGDTAHEGDQFLFNGEPLSDAVKPEDNFFNSRFSRYGKPFTQRTPNYTNLMGFDIAQVDLTGRLKNGDTSAVLSFSTNKDWYQPTAVSFMTDFDTDLSLNMRVEYPDFLKPNDKVTLVTEVANKGIQAYEQVKVRLNIPEGTKYNANSSSLDWQPLTDAEDDDAALQQADGSIQVSIPRLRAGETRTLRYDVTLTDFAALQKTVRIQNSALFTIPELQSQASVLSDANAEVAGIQPAYLFPVSITSPEEVAEGQQGQLQGHILEGLAQALTFRLQENSLLSWPIGQKQAKTAIITPADDKYKTAQVQSYYVEQLLATPVDYHPVVLNGFASTALQVKVKDQLQVTTLTLSAQDVSEGSIGALVSAQLSEPAQTPVKITLDQGEVIQIDQGQTLGQIRLAVPENDVYTSQTKLTRVVTSVEGGNFEEVDFSKAKATFSVLDTEDKTYLSLLADESVDEGGVINYTAKLSHAPRTDLHLKLSNGLEMTVPAGQTEVNAQISAPEDNPYINSKTLRVAVISMDGGGYENLVGADSGQSLVATTHIKDTINTQNVTLTAESIDETAGQLRFTATLQAPALTETRLILDLNEEIVIPAGASEGFVDIKIADNDVYTNPYTLRRTIVDVIGGGFESLNYQQVGTSAHVSDYTDEVTVAVSVANHATEGDTVTFTAKTSHPPRTDLLLTLNNGGSLTVPAGETVGQLNFQVPVNDPYISATQLSVNVANVSGGNFELLRVTEGALDRPLKISVADKIDQTSVQLVTSDVTENDQNLVFTALLSNPAQTDTRVTLDGGEVVLIKAGESSGFITVTKPDPDVYVTTTDISRKIVQLEGGNFEEVDLSKEIATARILDVIDTTTLMLSADQNTTEGAQINYQVRSDHPVQTDMQVTLNSGEILTILAGQQVGSLQVDAPKNDVYLSAHTLHRTIVSTSGGNFENLEIAQGSEEQPIRIQVQDSLDLNNIRLSSRDLFEGDNGVVLNLEMDYPAQTDAKAILSTGETINIAAGQKQAELKLPIQPDDVYLSEAQHHWSIQGFSGGHFEQVDFSRAETASWVRDTTDTTVLKLTAAPSVEEGGRVTYTAEVSNPAKTPMVVQLSQGSRIVIEAGQTKGLVVADSLPDDPYQLTRTLSVVIEGYTGGNFERVQLEEGRSDQPVITQVIDRNEVTWLELSALNVAEDKGFLVLDAQLSEPTLTPMQITLDNGESITIAAGDRSGQVRVPIRDNDPYITKQTLQRSVSSIKGGGFEQVDFNRAKVDVSVYETYQSTYLTINADDRVAEGGVIMYEGQLSEPPRSMFKAVLSNGAELNFAKGEQTATVEYPAPIDTVYKDAQVISTHVIAAEGGDFERITLTNATPASPVSTQVVDQASEVLLSLHAQSSYENSDTVKVTVLLSHPTASAATVALNTGDEITFAEGDRAATAEIKLRDDDPYLNSQQIELKVAAFTGGNFEQVNYQQAKQSITLQDTSDPTWVMLQAPAQVKAGENIRYVATVSNPPQQGVGLILSNGQKMVIPAGALEAVLDITAPAPTPYQKDLQQKLSIGRVTGGNFERLAIRNGGLDEPVITEVIQPPLPVKATLQVTPVADELLLAVHYSAIAMGTTKVMLSSGHKVIITDGADSAVIRIPANELSVAPESIQIQSVEAKGFREVQW